MEVLDIISRVQQQDLELFDGKIKAEAEQRRLLRLKENAGNLSIGELLAKIAGTEDEKADDLSMPAVKEETDGAPTISGFPAPPTGPSESSSSR